MKKSFPLTHPRHQPARVVERIKGEVGKYIKRERGKKLPEGVDYWDFNCKAGKEESSAVSVHLSELGTEIEAAAAEGWEAVYLEILAKAAKRRKKPGKQGASDR